MGCLVIRPGWSGKVWNWSSGIPTKGQRLGSGFGSTRRSTTRLGLGKAEFSPSCRGTICSWGDPSWLHTQAW